MDQLEKQLQAKVVALLHLRGLLTYHTFDSRRSNPGYPDLTIVGARGVAFRELKKDGGKVSADQWEWITALQEAGADIDIWFPADFPAKVDALARELGGIAPHPK